MPTTNSHQDKPATAARNRTQRKPVGYRDIADTLIGRIRNGVWRVGDGLPTELELIDEFKVGRTTVREALRQLQDLGYIRRQRGTRAVLTSPSADAPYVNSMRSVEELLRYSRHTHGKLLGTDQIRLDDALAKRLDCPSGSEWIRIAILRTSMRNQLPLGYSEIYIEPKYRDVIPHIEGEHTVYTVLEEKHNIVFGRIEQEIEATAADVNVASRLKVAEGSPILLVRTRFYATNGKLIEVGLSHFAAGQYRVRVEMVRRPPAAKPNN